MSRPAVIPCSVFRGRSQKTGKLVGERHRWPDGWGEGRCEYCGRYLEQVLEKPKPAQMTLDEAVKAGQL